MSKSEVTPRMEETAEGLLRKMTPAQRIRFLDRLGLMFKDIEDRAFSLVEQMTDEERENFFGKCDAYCNDCGQLHPEGGPEFHDCIYDDDEEKELDDRDSGELDDDAPERGELDDDAPESGDLDDEDERDDDDPDDVENDPSDGEVSQ